MEAKNLAKAIVKIARDKKAEDPVILEMLKVTNFCDYFVILSASSLRKAAAIAEAIEEELARDKISSRSAPISVQKESGWILLDFNSVIVHIFYKPLREFYCLEHLWQDAPRLKVRFPAR